jgi:hypothetical protein
MMKEKCSCGNIKPVHLTVCADCYRGEWHLHDIFKTHKGRYYNRHKKKWMNKEEK